MASRLEVIGEEWAERAQELSRWAFEHLVNRTDVWGSYVSKDRRRKNKSGRENIFFTAPFPAARGKVFLTPATLRKHFAAIDEGDLISLHSTSAEKTSRWLAIDIDRHDSDESATIEGNLNAVLHWYNQLVAKGFDPLLFDSNGAGGYHLLILFSEPIPTADVFAFGQSIIGDYEKRGLLREPETYPKQVCIDEGHYGNCLRVPGKHHTREHYSRVWSGEPEIEEWLEGSNAVSRILQTVPSSPDKLPRDLPVPERKKKVKTERSQRPKVCVDFDGVLAAYDGWKGLDFTGNPLPGAVEFTRRLAEFADVVVFTSRCCVESHRDELKEPTRPASDLAPRLQHSIRYWLDKYHFTYHEIYVGQGKPPASAYIDDRAIPCSPQLDPLAYQKAAGLAKLLCRGGPRVEQGDAELRAVVEAWAGLPEKVREKIMKQVGAAEV